mgnify:CR=1 FL=1
MQRAPLLSVGLVHVPTPTPFHDSVFPGRPPHPTVSTTPLVFSACCTAFPNHLCNPQDCLPSTISQSASPAPVRLQSLDLSANRLVGTVPEVLGSLPYLSRLDLADNSGLEGRLPPGLGSSNDLETFDVTVRGREREGGGGRGRGRGREREREGERGRGRRVAQHPASPCGTRSTRSPARCPATPHVTLLRPLLLPLLRLLLLLLLRLLLLRLLRLQGTAMQSDVSGPAGLPAAVQLSNRWAVGRGALGGRAVDPPCPVECPCPVRLRQGGAGWRERQGKRRGEEERS